jgi:hypothetical protein
MVMGRSYKAGRTMGRMNQDTSMRMTNKAEVGFGMVGMIVIVFVFLGILSLFL